MIKPKSLSYLLHPILIGLFFYFFIRMFSMLCPPQSFFNLLLATFYLIISLYLIYLKNPLGWQLIAMEMILGGIGEFLTFGPITLRTALLFFSLSLFLWQKKHDVIKKYYSSTSVKLIIALLVVALISAINGLFQGHAPSNVYADLIPYLFLLYYFPLTELLNQHSESKKYLFYCIFAAIIGNLIITLYTFFSFSFFLNQLQNGYYHWFRDLAGGKITYIIDNFYRVVLNEQILLAPLFIYFFGSIIKKQEKQNKLNIVLPVGLLIILTVNLTRIYILAICLASLCYLNKNNIIKWLKIYIGTTIIYVLSFVILFFIASRGQSMGWSVLGLRIGSIITPTIESSSLSRMILLPEILQNIKKHPILGCGFGNKLTVFSPVLNQQVTTYQYDWGYLEIWDEMGLFGIVAWSLLIFYILNFAVKNKINNSNYNSRINQSILVTLLIINLTSPALSHVFGLITIACLLATLKINAPTPISIDCLNNINLNHASEPRSDVIA